MRMSISIGSVASFIEIFNFEVILILILIIFNIFIISLWRFTNSTNRRLKYELLLHLKLIFNFRKWFVILYNSSISCLNFLNRSISWISFMNVFHSFSFTYKLIKIIWRWLPVAEAAGVLICDFLVSKRVWVLLLSEDTRSDFLENKPV